MKRLSISSSMSGISRAATGRRTSKERLGLAAGRVVEELEVRRLLAATTPVDINTAANAVREAAAVGTVVGVTASSTDSGGTAVTYGLTDDAGGRFGVDPTTGVVAVADGSLLDGPATHVITVEARDGAGGAASQSFTIAVNNAVPVVKVSGNNSAAEGGAYTVNLSSTDPGADTVSSWTIDWGDGSAPQAIAGNPSTATHVYPDGQPRPLLGTTLLNELKVNAPGPHGPYEYVELRGDPGAALQNLYFVSVEGDADPEPNEPLGAGTVEMVVGLTGHSFGASGLLVIKGTLPGHNLPADTTVVTSVNLDTPGKALENGSNSFLIVSSPTPPAEGTDYDADDDGVLELPAGVAVLDAVGWSDGGAIDKVYGSVALTQSSGVPDAATRFFGNTTANSAGAWFNGLLVGESDTVTYNTTRTSQNFPSAGELTPGASNVPVAVLPPPRLNELKVNPPTLTDGPYEYVELKGAPDQTLTRLFFVAVESDVTGTPGGIGRADLVANLSGVSLGSNGLLAIKSTTGGHAAADGTPFFTDTQLDLPGGGLENGSNSFLLVSSLDAIIEGTDYDTNDDGVLELPPGAVVLDAAGWSDGDAGDVVYGGVVLQQAGGGASHAASRVAHDSTPSSAAAWYNGLLAGTTSDSLAYDLTRASSNFPSGGALTPGADNVPPGTPPPTVLASANGYLITARATDEDGTYKANSLTVTVDDVAPTVAISGAASVNEGGTYGLTLGAAQDPGADTVSSYVVHWGDGSSDTYSDAGVATHSYAGGSNVYAITVDLVNEDSTFVDRANPLSVTVETLAAAGLSIGVNQASVAVDEGQIAANSGTWSGPAGAVVTLAASIGTAILGVDGTWSWSLGAADGPSQGQTVTVTATDDSGALASVSFDLLVNNVAPAVFLSVKTSVLEGETAVLHVAIADPGLLDSHVLVVNWGEGEPETVQVAAGTTELKLTHRYLDDNPTATGEDLYTIGVSLSDNDGGTAVATTTTTVSNVAADVQFRADDAARNALSRSFRGSFGDAGTLDSWAATVNYGDGSGDQLLELNTDGTFTFSHVYATADAYSVTVTVTDDDGGIRQVKRKVNIRS